ncbi:MAG: class I SAM-dependent methyltransferase [Acidobacteriota bacterium]
MTNFIKSIAKAALQLLPAYPGAEYHPLDQDSLDGALSRSRRELQDEQSGGLLKFFYHYLPINEVTFLDLGCGYGGRTIELQRRLGGHGYGLEIDWRMVSAARRFAQSLGVSQIDFVVGMGESLPFAANSMHLILSYDVFEHVQDPAKCLQECWRVLKPGGQLWLIFPPYFHPLGAHLEGYLSHLPYANLLFPAPILMSAIDEILAERGNTYRPRQLLPGHRIYTLNGLTIKRFLQLLADSHFEVLSLSLLPLFSKANRNYQAWRMKYYGWIFRILTTLPLLREIFTHRVVAVLRKPRPWHLLAGASSV